MAKINYCCDCDHYIPGGRERNCTVQPYSKDSVCAIEEACGGFIPREERKAVDFAPIKFRRVKKYSKKKKVII